METRIDFIISNSPQRHMHHSCNSVTCIHPYTGSLGQQKHGLHASKRSTPPIAIRGRYHASPHHGHKLNYFALRSIPFLHLSKHIHSLVDRNVANEPLRAHSKLEDMSPTKTHDTYRYVKRFFHDNRIENSIVF